MEHISKGTASNSPGFFLAAGIPARLCCETACDLAGVEGCSAGCPSQRLRTGLHGAGEREREVEHVCMLALTVKQTGMCARKSGICLDHF